jgi:hypothetical protein
MYKNNLNGIMAFARGGRIPQQLNFGFDFMNTGNPSENMYYNSDGTYNNGLKSQGIINQDINQMAFRPGSMKDRALKQLDVMPDMDQKRYDNLRKEDVDQFNEKGIPLSLPNDRYKGIEGFTSSLGNFFFSPAGAAEINPNNTFTSSVANSPYEMDYMPPNRYTDFEPRVGQDKFTINIMNPTAEEKLSLFEKGKDLASSGIGKAGKLGMDVVNMLKNNNPFGLISSGLGGLTNMLGGMFEDKQLYADTYDEFGNKYTADELNSMNARGGYYTDPARASRRRQNSIYRMEKRKADGKKIGETRLATLKAIEEKAQAARDKATADKVAAFQKQRAAETGAGSWGTGDEASTFGENIGSGGWDSYT